MRVIQLGNGDVSQWTGCNETTGVPFIAYAEGNCLDAPELPPHTVVVEFLAVANIQFHIDRLEEFKTYMLEVEAYNQQIKEQEEQNGEV